MTGGRSAQLRHPDLGAGGFAVPPRTPGVGTGVVAFGLALVIAAAEASAAGYAIREQSGWALGNAFAGSTAAAEDISYSFFNPAALARHSGNQILALATYIAPQTTFRASAASTVTGVAIGGGNGGGDAASDAVVPAFYAMWDAHPNIKVGFALNAPFGLETEYDDRWIGRYYAVDSRLRSVTARPSVAVRLDEMVSVGAGIQVQYVDATLTNAIDFGSIGAALGGVPTAQDGYARVEGDDIGVGLAVGILIEPLSGTRFGVAFRSQIDHELEGDAAFDLGPGAGRTLSALTGTFVGTGARADLTTPETVSFGVYHELNDQWAIMGEAAWTRWSRFDELRIRFDNPRQPDNVTAQDWNDSWFFAGGVTWRPNSDWSLRAGFAYDQAPMRENRRTPRIPTGDSTWLAVGGSYQVLPGLQVSLGYAHLFVGDGSVRLSATDPGSTFRGNLSGSSDNSVDLLSVQASWTF
jgi:long-chain fatty acid transport protein